MRLPQTYMSSEKAKTHGLYKGKERPFCLPQVYSDENLFDLIRENAKEFFMEYEIKWHDAINGEPSNHLCDSKVCSINFLYLFMKQP